MSLYKYYSPESVDFIFIKDGVSVRFSQPEILNDPFEVKPSNSHGFLGGPIEILKEVSSRIESGTTTFEENTRYFLKLADFIEDQKNLHQVINESVGILALSQRESSRAMWSYYAKDHSGFVIEFKDIETLEKGFQKTIVHKKVEYQESRNDINNGDLQEFIDTQIFYKDKDWIHEEEYRVYLNLKNLTPEGHDSLGFAIHKLVLGAENIERVILGYRASDTLKRKVLYWAENFAKNVIVEQSTLSLINYALEYVTVYEKPLEQETLFPIGLLR